MINLIEEEIQNLTDDELKQCFEEIQEYSEKGMIGDCLLRQIRCELAEKIGDKNWDCDCRVVVIPEVLYEIARRHYENEDNKEIEADII